MNKKKNNQEPLFRLIVDKDEHYWDIQEDRLKKDVEELYNYVGEDKENRITEGVERLVEHRNIVRLINHYKSRIIFSYTASTMAFMSIVLIGFARYEAYEVYNGKSLYEVAFVSNGKKFATDKEIVYVGRTKNYLFLHNKLQGKSYVYPVSDLKDLTLSPGIDYMGLPTTAPKKSMNSKSASDSTGIKTLPSH